MFATIDIGTNSALLLIGEISPDGKVRAVEDRALVTRLGEGLARSGVIADAAAERTLDALCAYWESCVKHGVERVAAVGTAVLRNAKNAGDFLLLAKRTLGLDIEVISADREAELTYIASSRDFGNDIVVIDIGGGSTEFITHVRGTKHQEAEEIVAVSLPLGCVSLTEEFLKGDPETNEEVFHLRREVHEVFERELDPSLFSRPHDRAFVATAGTATTLMAMHLKLDRYEPERVHGQTLRIDGLRDLIDTMRPKAVDERKKMPGLVPERADVILAGAEILQEAMSYLGYWDATISDRGVRWGLFYERFCS